MLLDSPHYAAMAMPLQIPSFDPFRRANSSLEIRQGRQQILPPPVLLMRRKIDSTRSKWQYVYLYENFFKAAEKINKMKYVIHHINGNKTKKSECNE